MHFDLCHFRLAIFLGHLLLLLIGERPALISGDIIPLFGPLNASIIAIPLVIIIVHSLAEVGIPVVLYLVVGPAWQSPGYEGPAVAEQGMEADDEVFLIRGYVPALDVGPEIVHPS